MPGSSLFPSSLLNLATLLLFLLVLPASAFAGSASEPILIGQSIDLSGPEGDIAKDFVTGAQTYFDKINLEGGIAGRKIRLLVSDNGGSINEMLKNSETFLRQQKVAALFGYSGNGVVQAISGSPVFRESGAVLIAPYSGADIQDLPTVYFIRPDNASELLKLANFYYHLGLRKFLLIHDGAELSAGRQAEIHSQFKTWGASLEERVIPRHPSASQLENSARNVLQNRPEVILLNLNTIASAEFAKAYLTQDASVLFGATSRVNTGTYYDLLGPARAEKTIITQVMPQPDAMNVPVVKEHFLLMKKFRDEPPSHATLEGHVAAKLLVNALKRLPPGQITPAAIMSTLRAMNKESVGGIQLSFASQSSRGAEHVYLTYFDHRGRLQD